MSSKNLANQKLLFLIFLFGLSFLIRIFTFYAFFQNNKTMTDFDSKVYCEVGVSVSEGKGLINQDGSHNFLRVPLYPIFLGACYKIFDANNEKALIFQAFISSIIPILIFFLSLLIFPHNLLVAKISSFLSSIHVGFVTFSNLLMAESLFTLFFLIFLITLFLALKGKNDKLIFFISGIILGVSSLFRPVGPLVLLTTLFIIILVQKTNIKASLQNCLVLFIGWFLIVLPWIARNFWLTGYIFFHTLPGIHFLKHLAARVVMSSENITYMQSLKKLDIELEKSLYENQIQKNRNSFEIEKCIHAEQIAKKYCLKYPIATLKHAIINMFKTAFGLYSAEIIFIDRNGELPEYENQRGISQILKRFLIPNVSSIWILITIYFEILFMLFLWLGNIGFILKAFFKKKLFDSIIRIFPFIFLFFFISLACGFARLRLPIEPFMIILSVYFWTNFYKNKSVV